jgi:hypothetical protein
MLKPIEPYFLIIMIEDYTSFSNKWVTKIVCFELRVHFWRFEERSVPYRLAQQSYGRCKPGNLQ